MQKTYLVVARLIAILIVVQAMAIVFVVAGLFHWIDGGATLDKSVVDGWDDNPPTFQGSLGGFIHFFLVGVVLIPLSGLILLIVSFSTSIQRRAGLNSSASKGITRPSISAILPRCRSP